MLTGDDVLDVVLDERRIGLAKMTVFAATAGPLPNGLAPGLGHRERPAAFRIFRALACRMAIMSRAST